MAYNRALDPSEPVCSDGITIDSSVPGVTEVVVKDSLVTGGLITDATRTNYYILGSDRMRRLIQSPTTNCTYVSCQFEEQSELVPFWFYDKYSFLSFYLLKVCTQS